MTCWHDYTKDSDTMNVVYELRCGHHEDIVQCVKCGDRLPLFMGKGYVMATRLATAAIAEKDAEIERLRGTLKTVKAAMEVVSRTELDGSGGRDAIAKRVEKRHGNAMAMAFKEVFDVLAAT